MKDPTIQHSAAHRHDDLAILLQARHARGAYWTALLDRLGQRMMLAMRPGGRGLDPAISE